MADGLDGVEVYYYDHTPKVTSDLYLLAKQYDSAMTVGSDFHRREGDGSARIGSVRFPAILMSWERYVNAPTATVNQLCLLLL